MSGLNPEQTRAVETLSGPLLVLAGAGSGKTRVVTFRIARLIKSGIRPNRILAVTFTNKAAKEMRQRIATMLGRPQKPRWGKDEDEDNKPVIGTFHSNCVRILRRHAKRLGYPEKFAIYDRGDQESVARDVLRQLHVHSGMLKPGDLLSHISRWKNAGVRPESAPMQARTDAEHVASAAYGKYQQAVKLAGAMDFDDLLLLTEELLTQDEEVRLQESKLYDHILVDEYQDTNQSQYSIIKQLAKDHRNICVVGDDDQSIYGWRGAEVHHILNFDKDWREANVVRLEANYRSTSAILQLANELISHNKTRHDKVLKPARMGGQKPRILQFKNENEEAEKVSEEIMRVIDTRTREPRDFAILFRTNEQPRVFEQALRKCKIPYSLVGTQSFFDRREVKDLVSYLKLIDNPKDEVALLRIINFPQRGIGAKSVESLMNSAVKEGRMIWEILMEGATLSKLPLNAQSGVKRLHDIVTAMRVEFGVEKQPGSPSKPDLVQAMRYLLRNLDYFNVLNKMYPDPEEADARKSSVEEFVNTLADYAGPRKKPTLSGFLDDIALAGKEFGSDGKQKDNYNAVTLMTYHSAKAWNSPSSTWLAWRKEFCPIGVRLQDNADDVEEERRLCYVGITRAEDELTLSLPLERKKWENLAPPSSAVFSMR